MDPTNSQTQMSVTERDYLEFVQRGDDFFKVELLRPAISWYNKALAINTASKEVKYKIDECERLLVFERKIVRILLAIGSVLILAYIIFFR